MSNIFGWISRHWVITVLASMVLIVGVVVVARSGSAPSQSAHKATHDHVPVVTVPASPTTTVAPITPRAVTGSGSSTASKSVTFSPTTASIGSTASGTSTTTTTQPATSPTTSSTTAPGATVTYHAYIDPTFVQSPTNPLAVVYSYSAAASSQIDGVSLGVTPLPAGILQMYSDGVLACSTNIGDAVTGGSCPITYTTFGVHTVVTNYITNATTAISETDSEDIEPYATTTVVSAYGGGSQGGLVVDAAVTDNRGNPVMTGTVTLTVSDPTQNWAYTVSGVPGADGGHTDDFACIFIENAPKVGEYQGCGIGGTTTLTPTPVGGDVLTLTAKYSGATDWAMSEAPNGTYTFPS